MPETPRAGRIGHIYRLRRRRIGHIYLLRRTGRIGREGEGEAEDKEPPQR